MKYHYFELKESLTIDNVSLAEVPKNSTFYGEFKIYDSFKIN